MMDPSAGPSCAFAEDMRNHNAVGQLLKVEEYNQQQQLFGTKSVQQMMTDQKTHTYNGLDSSKNNRLDTAVGPDLSKMFLDVEPVMPVDWDDMAVKNSSIVDSLYNETTLSEIYSNELMECVQFINGEIDYSGMEDCSGSMTPCSFSPPVDKMELETQPPVQDTTVSSLLESSNGLFCKGKSALDPNLMRMEVASTTSCLIGTGCQTGLNHLPPLFDLVTYIAQGKYNIPMEENDNTATVRMEKEIIGATLLMEKDDSQNGCHLNVSGKVFPERSCKTNSREKIRKLVCEESDLEQEFSSVVPKASKNRVKKDFHRFKPYLDYEEDTRSSGTISPTYLVDVLTEKELLKRRRNNEASKRSRNKRKQQDKLTEKEYNKLKKRNDHLLSTVAKLEKVAETVIASLKQTANRQGSNLLNATGMIR